VRGAAKLQAAANVPEAEAGSGSDVRGGLGGDVPAASVSAGASSAARRGVGARGWVLRGFKHWSSDFLEHK
jgi:hypothetical protein